MFLQKIYRKFFEIFSKLLNFARIVHLRLKYPKLKINFGSFISANCQIACTDNSEMILEDVYLAPGVVIRADEGGKMKIEKTYIGFNSVIIAIENIQIERNCEIAEMVVIRDQDHRFGDGKLLSASGMDSAPIKFGTNVWIGAKATILKGVSIGDNAVIGANAVVTKNVLENTVAVGIPAKNPKRIADGK